MDYEYQRGDEKTLLLHLGPLFTQWADPLDVQIALRSDADWRQVRLDLQVVGSRLLRLELLDGTPERSIVLGEYLSSTASSAAPTKPSAEERKLWGAVIFSEGVPESMEIIVRDLLLTTGVDSTPANAERVIEGYALVAKRPGESVHIGLAILRANTIARSRKMSVERTIREEALLLAERVLTSNVFPGIALRHAGIVAQDPRMGARAEGELGRLTTVLNRIDFIHVDPSTADWIAQYRLEIAKTESEQDHARRRHVEHRLALSAGEDHPMRAMLWAEDAANLAQTYGLQKLRNRAVLRMQELSREDFGWDNHVREIQIPSGAVRQRQRVIAKFSSWEQAVAAFLASNSPSGDDTKNLSLAAARRPRILDFVSRRTFNAHQLPERAQGSAEEERLRQVVQENLAGAAILLSIDLSAIAAQFGVPDEEKIVVSLSSHYQASPKLVRPYAQALRHYWKDDFSEAARLAIPLVESACRGLLLLLNEPLYRTESGTSPGHYPALDFYIKNLESLGLDPNWVSSIRGTLLSDGMNLRNRWAHGAQFDFSREHAALLLRITGLFITMAIDSRAFDEVRIQEKLTGKRGRLRRRIGWVWR